MALSNHVPRNSRANKVKSIPILISSIDNEIICLVDRKWRYCILLYHLIVLLGSRAPMNELAAVSSLSSKLPNRDKLSIARHLSNHFACKELHRHLSYRTRVISQVGQHKELHKMWRPRSTMCSTTGLVCYGGLLDYRTAATYVFAYTQVNFREDNVVATNPTTCPPRTAATRRQLQY